MTDHIEGREQIIDALRQELVGPSPAGAPLDVSHPIVFDTAKDSYGPWAEAGTGQEILQRDAPTKRYGIGVLYPAAIPHKRSRRRSSRRRHCIARARQRAGTPH